MTGVSRGLDRGEIIVFFSDYLTIDFEEILKGFEEIFGESKHKETLRKIAARRAARKIFEDF